MNPPVDRGLVVIDTAADGTSTVYICATVERGEPVGVYAKHTGLAAVQQLFEALGLARPPKVHLSEDVIELSGAPGARIEYVLAALTDSDRAVAAFATSDQPWLEIGTPIFRGHFALRARTAVTSGTPAALSVEAPRRTRRSWTGASTQSSPTAAGSITPSPARTSIVVVSTLTRADA